MNMDDGRVPNFKLYGEPQQSLLPDVIHIETLKDRSQHHDWQIRPHRHFDLFQVIWLRTSDARVKLDDQMIATTEPSVVVIPPPTIHGFEFLPSVEGTVTTIPLEHLAEFKEDAVSKIHAGVIAAGCREFDYITHCLADLEDEYLENRPIRWRLLANLVRTLMIWLQRASIAKNALSASQSGLSSAEMRAFEFVKLVEHSFADALLPKDYAAKMSVSTSQLARNCKDVLGMSPLRVIHDRVVKEAQRKLAYTPWTVSQIAEALGFEDVAYFSRFYSNQTGETPTSYRRRVQLRATQSDAPQRNGRL